LTKLHCSIYISADSEDKDAEFEDFDLPTVSGTIILNFYLIFAYNYRVDKGVRKKFKESGQNKQIL
jgi:hypothetical protein